MGECSTFVITLQAGAFFRNFCSISLYRRQKVITSGEFLDFSSILTFVDRRAQQSTSSTPTSNEFIYNAKISRDKK